MECARSFRNFLEQSNENTNNQRHGTTANIIGKDKNGNGNIDVNYNQLYQ